MILIALGLFFIIHGFVDRVYFQEKELLGFGIIAFAVIQLILFMLLNQQNKETVIFTDKGITVNYSWYRGMGEIPWSEVKDVRRHRLSGRAYFSVYLKNRRELIKKVYTKERLINKYDKKPEPLIKIQVWFIREKKDAMKKTIKAYEKYIQ